MGIIIRLFLMRSLRADFFSNSPFLPLCAATWSAQVVMHQTAVCDMKGSLPEVDQQ